MESGPPWTHRDADREFRAIRERLFPDWSDGEHWTLVFGHHPDYPRQPGLCVPLSQILYVPRAASVERWRTILVHEICHAITGTHHGPEFYHHLAQAARRAEALGETSLAAALLRETDFPE